MSWKSSYFKLPHKYKAERVKHAGFSFASQGEAGLHAYLKLLQQAGEILEIQVQPQVELTRARIICKPDFKLTMPDGSTRYAEFKGFETDVWRIKRKLWMFYGPAELDVYKGSGVRCRLVETLVPDVVK